MSSQKSLLTTQPNIDYSTLFRQALANGAIGTWVWDIKTQKVIADKNLAQMFGLDVEKAKSGLPIQQFIQSVHQDDRQRVNHDITKALNMGTLYENEYRTISADGSVRWVIARGRVELDKTGEAISFPGVVVDITERKNAEASLAESENRLRFMADSMPQLVWITRPDGYHEYYNQKWYQYTGVETNTTDGEGWNDLFHPDDRERAWKIWRQSLKTGDPYEIEYRLYHAPSNTYRWVIGRALPFKAPSGKILKWYGTCTDIDEQKRASQLQSFLAEASKQLGTSLSVKETLQKISQICVPTMADWCSVDMYDETTDTFEQVNVAHDDPKRVSFAREYRLHNPPSVDGKTGISKVVKTGKSEFYPYITNELLEKAIKDPKKLKFMQQLNLHSIIIIPINIHKKPAGAISFISTDSGRYYTEDDLQVTEELGARISLAITNSKLYDESVAELKHREKLETELLLEKQKLESRVKERTQQLQLTNQGLRDEIVKRHKVEQELQLNSENLARSNQELQDFAYVASHDLQEPLRKIQAFGNLLESEYGAKLGEGMDYLSRMRNAASRMSILIEDLLSFSRVTTKARPSVDVDLNTIVSNVNLDLESRIEDTKGVVKVDHLPIVTADPTHMRQLFQNLIGNALKFHKPDEAPHVHVSYKKDDSEFYEIKVSDDGIGFDVKYTDRIFSVFQRLHDRETYEGTGIGLAICRKIVERYGGTITANSTKNKGATFMVRLPKKVEG